MIYLRYRYHSVDLFWYRYTKLLTHNLVCYHHVSWLKMCLLFALQFFDTKTNTNQQWVFISEYFPIL